MDVKTKPPPAFTIAWHKKSTESFARVLRSISAHAHSLARNSRQEPAESVHEARLLVKRVRALLWFARPALAKTLRTHLQAQLRKTAHLLAVQRDLQAAQSTLKKLSVQAAKNRARAAVKKTFRALSHHANGATVDEHSESIPRAAGVFCAAVDKFAQAAEGATKWPSPAKRTDKAFRAMRKAGKKAQHSGADADFHAWRKKTKRLLFLLELRDVNPSGGDKRLLEHVDELQATLGKDHDCAVTAQQLSAHHQRRGDARRVVKLLHQRQSSLRKKSRELARLVEADV